MNLLELNKIYEECRNRINLASNSKDLEELKIALLGRKGSISDLVKQLGLIQNIEDKKKFGQKLNDAKKELDILFQEKEKSFSSTNYSSKPFLDVTCSQPSSEFSGSLHFYSQFCEEIENIFLSLGFQIFEGPEVESDFYNFTALNIGEDHPARDMYDTLWLSEQNKLLRTHTSSVQIRAMQKFGAPLAGISVGRVFRHEALDATHEIVFTQCEGLFVDKNVSLANLFGIAKKVLQSLFNKQNIDIRVRPGFFPFVVPGIEIDMKCVFCKSGCNVCKKSTWIEVFPGGLVHPKVLTSGGIDPKIYSGFAFGFGVERLAMLRHQIRDIRVFKSGDMRFLDQF